MSAKKGAPRNIDPGHSKDLCPQCGRFLFRLEANNIFSFFANFFKVSNFVHFLRTWETFLVIRVQRRVKL